MIVFRRLRIKNIFFLLNIICSSVSCKINRFHTSYQMGKCSVLERHKYGLVWFDFVSFRFIRVCMIIFHSLHIAPWKLNYEIFNSAIRNMIRIYSWCFCASIRSNLCTHHSSSPFISLFLFYFFVFFCSFSFLFPPHRFSSWRYSL